MQERDSGTILGQGHPPDEVSGSYKLEEADAVEERDGGVSGFLENSCVEGKPTDLFATKERGV